MKVINIYSLLLLLMVGGLFSSCTMETEVHFNEQMGGSQIVSFNMKDMMDMASSFGGGETGEMDELMNQFNDPKFADSIRMMEDSMSTIFAGTGVDNFSIAMSDDGIMSMGFDFASIETFEKAADRLVEMAKQRGGDNPLGDSEMSGMMNGMVGGGYELKGRWLKIPLKQNGMLREMMGGMAGDDTNDDQEMNDMMAMMEGFMGESIMFKNTYSFDKTIKKIKGDIPFKQDGNTLFIEYSLSDALDWVKEDKEAELCVKLK